MKVAFDFDGTITAYPLLCETLALAMKSAGHRVVILTGTVQPNPTNEQREAGIKAKKDVAARLGFKSYDELICCFIRNSMEAAAYKAGYCQGEGIDIFIDDAPDYCQAVKQACPNILVLHVHEIAR